MPYQNLFDLIGWREPPSIFLVERETIRRYADAIDDSNPLYYDEEYAKKSRHGGILAPPGFISSPWFMNRPQLWPARPGNEDVILFSAIRKIMNKAGFNRLVDGGQEFEFFKQVKAGNTITVETIVKNLIVTEKHAGNKTARMIIESVYKDLNLDRVATLKWNLVFSQEITS